MTVTQASNGSLHVVVVDAERCQRVAEQADIDAAEHLPDRADDIPRNEQRQRHQHEADRNAPALARHVERDEDAERDLDREDDGGEDQIAAQRVPEAVGMQDLVEPVGARPEELVVAERVLHRIVDHRHQRDDRRERHQQQHRQHHEPGLVVPGLFHGSASHSTRQESA